MKISFKNQTIELKFDALGRIEDQLERLAENASINDDEESWSAAHSIAGLLGVQIETGALTAPGTGDSSAPSDAEAMADFSTQESV